MSLLYFYEMIDMYYGGNMYGIFVLILWCLVLGVFIFLIFLVGVVVYFFIVLCDLDNKKKFIVYLIFLEKSSFVIFVVMIGFYLIEKIDFLLFEVNLIEDLMFGGFFLFNK